MGYLPAGYVLYVEHSLMERAALLMKRLLEEWLDAEALPVTVEMTPMRQHELEHGGVEAEMGTLMLTSETLLTMDATAIRTNVDRIATEAAERMDAINAQETILMRDFLSALKREPADG